MASSTFEVFCSFCDEKFTSQQAMVDHLMMCGNKTDQCPNCTKYIRRAIFAYHYENDCANPDAPTTDDNTRPITPTPVKTPVSVRCKDCQQNYDRADRKAHKANCLRNPANRSKNQQSSNGEDFNQNADRSRQSNGSDDDALIPCEWCHQGVPLNRYQQHAETCRDEEHKRLEEKARRASQSTVPTPTPAVTIRTPSATESAPCKFCEKLMSSNGLTYHQLICVKNPHRNKN